MGFQPSHASNNIKILYEDDFYIVFDKPAGLLVIPTPKNEKNTLIDIVNRLFTLPGVSCRLHPCHRLDRETSGVIVFAKGKKNQQSMMDLFKYRRVKKTYKAFIQGRLNINHGELRTKINDFDHKKFHKHSQGQWALTHYKVIERKKDFCVIEAYPVTGRTNQIRIQFAEAGFPLVGERKYAFARDFALKFRRTALHASELECLHPFLHKPLKVTSPLPTDMSEFLSTH